MQFPAAFLDELRQRTSLSALISREVKLRRAGHEWQACCPFHVEKTASFTVNDEKGFYHCFGCGAHGDAIAWLVERKGMTFLDAVRELAGAAGIAVPLAERRDRDDLAPSRELLARAAEWFGARLADGGGGGARDYLAARGITPALARRFGLGFAPASRTALRSALAGAGDARLIEAGLLVTPEGGGAPYDRFRDRLMIPIRDARGRVIAFGGRALGEAAPKYLNSPETPLFDKGRTLFNLDRAAAPARRSGRLIVVEGYLDVIALAGVGIEEAVAPLGTAITEAQLGLAWRVASSPVLMLDGDAAGRHAAARTAIRALPALAPDRTLRFATLPPGRDPDDLARAGGAAAIEAVAAAASPFADFLFEHEVAASDLTSPESRAALRGRLDAHAVAISDRELARQYRTEFRDRAWRLFRAPPARSSRSTRRVAATDIDAALLGAVLHGLHCLPDVAGAEIDRLAILAGLVPTRGAEIDRLLGAALRGERPEAPPLPEMGFRFAFNRPEPTVEAAEQLVEMIGALVERAEAKVAA